MIIEKSITSIEIYLEPNELLPYQLNQLRFYGFKKELTNSLSYIYEDQDLDKKILQVVNYLQSNGCVLQLSPTVKKVLEEEKAKTSRFSNLKCGARDFKNGIFEEKAFLEFCDFAALFPREFKQHQKKAAYHHTILMNSADFSVPGSGKTATELLTYEYLRNKNEVNCLFVVGPPSCFTAWKREFELTLGRSPKLKTLTGLPKEARIGNYYNYFDETELFLISYQSFANDYQHIKKFFSHISTKVFFVVDEAHYIKQLEGAWATAVLDAGKEASCVQILTGTPCPHSYSDLFNLFDLIWGKNTVINEVDKTRIIGLEKGKRFVEAGEIIQSNIDPFFYRVRKGDLGLTEPIFHSPIIIDMHEHEREIYDAVFKRISHLSKFDNEKNIDNLISLKRGRIIRLRQLTSYCKLLGSAIDQYNEELGVSDLGNLIINYDNFENPAKLEALVDLIRSIRSTDRKIVVWSNFIGTINLLEDKIKSIGIGCNHIYGTVPIIDDPYSDILTRERIIDEFLSMESQTDILIANPAACAESISLHKTCHHAIYYDLSYNCGQYLQSLDRIHRVGGSETTFSLYYHLMYKDTIEEDIFSNLELKRDKMIQVIETDSDIYNLNTDIFVDTDNDQDAYNRLFSK